MLGVSSAVDLKKKTQPNTLLFWQIVSVYHDKISLALYSIFANKYI